MGLALGVQEANWPLVSAVGWETYTALALTGFIAISGQIFYTIGMQIERPAVASVTKQLDVPLAFLWQVLVFGQTPSAWSVVGSCLILLGATAVIRQRLLV